MVRHHVLIGLGFKKQNFRNRALQYMMDRNMGRGTATMRPAVMPPSYSRPTVGRGPLPAGVRAPLNFNY